MLASVLATAALAIYGLRHRSVQGALAFAAVMLCGVMWGAGAILELAALDTSTEIFWVQFQGLWQIPAVTATFWFVLEYSHLNRWLTRRTAVLLALPPLLFLLLAATNPAHHWIWLEFTHDNGIRFIRGPANWLFIAYGYGLSIASLLVFVWLAMRSPQHRVPIALILSGLLAMRVMYALDLLDVNPLFPMDPTVVFFVFPAMMYALALFRFQLFNLVPIAREAVIAQMREGMLVLDHQGRVIDLNRAAEQILDVPAARARGQPAMQILPRYSYLAPLLNHLGQSRRDASPSELILGTGNTARHYALELSPIKDQRGLPLGDLVLFHDITEQKQAQSQLLEQQRLVAALQERERLARNLHDDLAQTLAFVNVQAQSCHELLMAQDTALADARVQRLATIARQADANLRTLIADLRAPTPADSDFIRPLQQDLDQFGKDNSIQTEFCAPAPPLQVAFEPNIQAQLFRIIQEALNNIRKHAHATRVALSLTTLGEQARVIVEDDGVGFDLTQRIDEDKHLGLQIMRERAAEVGGQLVVQSAPGQGTRVVVEVPIKAVNSG